MDNQNQTHFSLFLSSLGWILLVVFSGVFLLWMKPMAYEKGLADQYEADLSRVDALIGADETAVDGIPGQIDRVVDGSLILSAAIQPQNPLRAAYPSTREVKLSDSTKYTLRTLISEEEFANRVAASNGTEPVAPFDERVGSLADVVNGATVLVIPTSIENIVYQESFEAAEVIVDISNPLDIAPIPAE